MANFFYNNWHVYVPYLWLRYSNILMQERDVWMANALHEVQAMAVRDAPKVSIGETTHVLPRVIVGVVGETHQPGIIEEWKRLEDSSPTNEERQKVWQELAKIPPPSAFSRVLSFAVIIIKQASSALPFVLIVIALWSCYTGLKSAGPVPGPGP